MGLNQEYQRSWRASSEVPQEAYDQTFYMMSVVFRAQHQEPEFSSETSYDTELWAEAEAKAWAAYRASQESSQASGRPVDTDHEEMMSQLWEETLREDDE